MDPATNTNRNEKLDYASPAVASDTTKPSKAARWAGWIISAIPILWMGVLGTVFALTQRAMVEESMTKYGYPVSTIIPIHIVAVLCVILYAIPRTAVLGAILLTGYLGGAVATHVQKSERWFFPVIFGVLIWLGLYLRDLRVRELAPLRKV
jgi:hypothetical protein